VEAGQLLQCGRQWMSYLEQEFRPRAMHRKYPVMLEREGRFFSAVLDTVLDTDAGWVIIQNSSFDNDHNGGKWDARAQILAPWLLLAGEALAAATGRPQVRTMVHFVLSSVLVEIG